MPLTHFKQSSTIETHDKQDNRKTNSGRKLSFDLIVLGLQLLLEMIEINKSSHMEILRFPEHVFDRSFELPMEVDVYIIRQFALDFIWRL